MKKCQHREATVHRRGVNQFPDWVKMVCIFSALCSNQYAHGEISETETLSETAAQMLDVLRPYCDMEFIGSARLSVPPVWDEKSNKWMARFEASEVIRGPTGVLDVEVGESMKDFPVSGIYENIKIDESWRVDQTYYLYCKGYTNALRIGMVNSLSEWNQFREMISGFTTNDLERAKISFRVREKYTAKRNLVIQEFMSGKLNNEEYMHELKEIADAWKEESQKEVPPNTSEY